MREGRSPIARPASRHPGPEASPGFLLWRTTLAWQRQIRAALRPHDLTHVQFVLLASLWWLEDHEGPPTQADVASQAGTDPMMTSQVIRRLEGRELVERWADPDDSRALRLRLTPAGSALVATALAEVEAADAAYFGVLDKDANAALVRFLQVLAGHLSD